MNKRVIIITAVSVAVVIGIVVVILAVTLSSAGINFEGLQMAPKSDEDNNAIHYQRGSTGSWGPLATQLGVLLDVYQQPNNDPDARLVRCDNNRGPQEGEVCIFNVNIFNPYCTADNHYGYDTSGPCVFIYPKMVPGWVPDFYNNSRELPDEMPRSLKDTIKSLETINRKELRTLWMSCEFDDHPPDQYLRNITYIPGQAAFPGFYFPYNGQKSYQNPIAAIKFSSLNVRETTKVSCRVWAKNIDEHAGTIRFEILIET